MKQNPSKLTVPLSVLGVNVFLVGEAFPDILKTNWRSCCRYNLDKRVNMMNENIYDILTNQASKRKVFNHYTNIDALVEIISNRSLRLSRLETVKDLNESRRVPELWKRKLYVCCFTHRLTETVTSWKDYAGGRNGLRISFNAFIETNRLQVFFDKECCDSQVKMRTLIGNENVADDKTDNWHIYDLTLSDVGYTDDFEEFVFYDDELRAIYKDTIMTSGQDSSFRNHRAPGLIKGIEWDYEEETRILIALKPKGLECYLDDDNIIVYKQPKEDYIYVKLTDDLLNRLIITVNPWATEDFGNRVRRVMDENGIEGYTIKKSRLTGTIRE